MTVSRGTTNSNARGSTADRAARRHYLIETFRADVDVKGHDFVGCWIEVPYGYGVRACRCYRCGRLLTEETVTADRIIPGCQGGTYRRSNIRPACLRCNSRTGATIRRKVA